MTEIEKMAIENRRMREALAIIADWKPPEVESRGEMVAYCVAYGSNGERDYMRQVARQGLTLAKENS